MSFDSLYTVLNNVSTNMKSHGKWQMEKQARALFHEKRQGLSFSLPTFGFFYLLFLCN